MPLKLFKIPTAVLLLISAQAYARTGNDCHPQALRDLQKISPDGYQVYVKMKDKKQFLEFVTCDDLGLGLSTAVHESVHILTEDLNGYPPIDGGKALDRSGFSRGFPPKLLLQEMKNQLGADNSFIETYIKPGMASSSGDLTFLLDELNAFSHDVNTAAQVSPVMDKNRDGMAAYREGHTHLMAFLAAYLKRAKDANPNTWEVLQRDPAKTTIVSLWRQAEKAQTKICAVKSIEDRDDQKAMDYLYNSANQSGIKTLLGPGERIHLPPSCPGVTIERDKTAILSSPESEAVL